MRIPVFAYAKTKTQISFAVTAKLSFAVTAKLISAFVFVTRIVESLYFLNLKFQASSHLLWLYRPVCVGPGRKYRRLVFSERGSNILIRSILPWKAILCYLFSPALLYFIWSETQLCCIKTCLWWFLNSSNINLAVQLQMVRCLIASLPYAVT